MNIDMKVTKESLLGFTVHVEGPRCRIRCITDIGIRRKVNLLRGPNDCELKFPWLLLISHRLLFDLCSASS